MDAGASASAEPVRLPVRHVRPVEHTHLASWARPAGAASHSRKGVGRGLDRPLAASAAGPRPAITARRPVNLLKDRGRGLRGTEKRKMNTSVNELLSNPAFRPLVLLDVLAVFLMIIFVMAGTLLIVGKLAGKRPASIAFGVLMIAWGLLCGIPESRSWMLARATDLEHTLEAMWAGLDGDGRMLVYIFALWLMAAIVIMMGGRR